MVSNLGIYMLKNYKNLELKFSAEEGFSLFGTDLQTSEYIKIIHAPVSTYDPLMRIFTFEATQEACEDITKIINEALNPPAQEGGTVPRLSDIDESVEESATKKRMREYFRNRNRDNALVTIKRH